MKRPTFAAARSSCSPGVLLGRKCAMPRDCHRSALATTQRQPVVTQAARPPAWTGPRLAREKRSGGPARVSRPVARISVSRLRFDGRARAPSRSTVTPRRTLECLALSRRKQGFESPRERQYFQSLNVTPRQRKRLLPIFCLLSDRKLIFMEYGLEKTRKVVRSLQLCSKPLPWLRGLRGRTNKHTRLRIWGSGVRIPPSAPIKSKRIRPLATMIASQKPRWEAHGKQRL